MRIFLLLAFLLAPLTALAQDRSRAILVMDGSGSMWGQIEGKAKITIAQDVVRDLLGTLPADMDLGLTIYGHRRKGDCSDIETVVTPGAATQAIITEAVNRIKPKGKTPMTEAVRQAALALRYTEEKATVILVSDGIETCDPDPCAAARALEEAGVDFTAHVIGFDVTDTEALRQMQCLADETGGTFLSAANSAELAEAMTKVVEATPAPQPAPEPEPAPVTITFNATDGKDGPIINDALIWDLTQGGQSVVDTTNADRFALPLLPGEYHIEVMRPADEATAEMVFGVGQVTKTVTLVLPEYRPAATLDAAATAVAGSDIPVRWSGPNAKNDFIAVSKLKARDHITYSYTKEGSPLDLQMPADPGNYELRYILAQDNKVLATQPLTVTDVTATVTADGALPAGGLGLIRWEGPDYRNDFVAVAKKGAKRSETYEYTRQGSPLEIRLPAEPGEYELRYVMNQTNRVLAAVPITVAAVSATLTPPADLPAGGTVQVGWTGPNDKNDYIAIFPRGGDKYVAYAYTRHGNPVDLTLPAVPGDYDLAYVQSVGRTVLKRVPVALTAVTATVTPPAGLPAGATVSVEWSGPNDKNDYIAIFPRGADDYVGYAYTRHGSPVDLTLPAVPGDYDLAYVQSVGRTVIARVPVALTAVTATVRPPADLTVGATVSVEWTGPNDKNDYIAIFPRGGDKYVAYAYTRNGSPAKLTLPTQPGPYDLAYVQRVGGTVIARVPMEVR